MSVEQSTKLEYVAEALERMVARETKKIEALEQKFEELSAGERVAFAVDQVEQMCSAVLRLRYFQEVLHPLKENRSGMSAAAHFSHLFNCVARDVAVGAASGHSTSWAANVRDGIALTARGEVLRLFLNLG